MPSRCASGNRRSGRCVFRLMTPVGVFAKARSSFTSLSVQGLCDRRLCFGFVLRDPFLPIKEPGYSMMVEPWVPPKTVKGTNH